MLEVVFTFGRLLNTFSYTIFLVYHYSLLKFSESQNQNFLSNSLEKISKHSQTKYIE